MKYEKKKEIVEALKKNERAYVYLSADEKEVLAACTALVCLQTDHVEEKYGCTHNYWQSPWNDSSYLVWRIHRDYQLPIEAPEGYRLVTEEETKKHVAPRCAMYFGEACGEWIRNTNPGEEVSKLWNGMPHAVPVDFTFEVKERTMAQLIAELGYSFKLVK